jgi:flagellin
MVINTNVLALNSHRNMGRVGNQQARASERLSSGLRINSAADDAAGLAISENMRSQINGLNQASRNGQDGISLLQTTEGGLTEIQNMTQRARELTVQAANDTNTADDRAMIANEIIQLSEEVLEMSTRVEFNSMNVLSMGGEVSLQVGANADQLITIDFDFDLDGVAQILSDAADVIGDPASEAADISALLDSFDDAISQISGYRATLGASQNRVEYTVSSLDISSENLSASESRIRDADMGLEMMRLTQANVLQQAAMSMLSQANQAPQGVLQLLR